MSVEKLCALPVQDIAGEDCAMFFWVTSPMLPEALQIIKAWGFKFKTAAFVWLKKNKKADSFFFGLGFWTRGNVEICLLATRGRPKRQNRGISQLIVSPIEAHSKKPDVVRDKIVELMGDISRIELFARERAEGWDALGNEIDGRDIRDALMDVVKS
jgi:N6-adenosine-specific RNA methylase IME4